MLSRKKRLTTKLFEEVMKHGTSYHVPHFSLRFYRLDTLGPSRFSFSVPKKLESRAVGRNTVRRRMSAIIRKYEKSLPHGYAAIIFAKKGAVDLSFQEIHGEMHQLLLKAFKTSVISSV